MREFLVEVRGDVVIRLDEAVIDAVDDEWRESFYDLQTAEDIVKHMAWNLFVQGRMLSNMDGWADQPHTNAELLVHDHRCGSWEFEVVELARPEGV